jgi:hypothetical protein
MSTNLYRCYAVPLEARCNLLELIDLFLFNFIAIEAEVNGLSGTASDLSYTSPTFTIEARITVSTVSIYAAFRLNCT